MKLDSPFAVADTSSDTLSGSSQNTGRLPALEVPPQGGVAHVEPPPSPPVTPLLLLTALRRRFKLAAFAGLTAAAVGAAVDALLPPPATVYTAHALVRIGPPEAIPRAGAARVGAPDLKTQVELIKTRAVLSVALGQGPAAELPVVRRDPTGALNRLAAELRFEPVGPQIVRIALDGTAREDLPVLVNAVKDAYLREVAKGDRDLRERRKAFLEAAGRDCDARLAEVRTRLVEAEGNGLSAADKRVADAWLAALQAELLRTELALHHTKIESTLGAVGGTAPGPRAAGSAGDDPVVQQYHAQVTRLDGQIAGWHQVAASPESHPNYQALHRDRQALSEAADDRVKQLARRQSEGTEADRATRAARTRDQSVRLEKEEKLIRELVVRETAAQRRRDAADPSLDPWRAAAARLEATARQIGDELQGLRLEELTAARSAAVQEAAEPVLKHAPQPIKRTVPAILGPLVAAVAAVAVWELRARRVYGPADIRAGVRARVLGAVPRPSGRDAKEAGWPTPVTDAVDAVCEALRPAPGAAVPRVLMVTSAAPREGKSTLARLLADRLARAGRRTLLIDADLYRPTAHQAYRLPAGPGLADVLAGAVEPSVAVRPGPDDGLFVLTAGVAEPRAFDALAGGAVGPLLVALRTAFDVVVVDASPVLATALPLLIGRHADAAVVATLSGTSRTPEVADCVRRLSDLGVAVAGVVVNGATDAGRYSAYFRPGGRARRPEPALLTN